MIYNNNKPHNRRLINKRGRAYGRMEVYEAFGFPASVVFTKWLHDNYFISADNLPLKYLIEGGYMKNVVKRVYPDDSNCQGREVKTANQISTVQSKLVNVPLFTNQGIIFFKWILENKNELKRISMENKQRMIQQPSSTTKPNTKTNRI